MPKQDAYNEAIRVAVEQLTGIDFNERCQNLGVSIRENGMIDLRAFARDLSVRQTDFQVFHAETDEPAKSSDRILVLHYLLCDSPISLTNQLISFRALRGGQFYWQPFLSRTVRPLLGRIGNNPDLLHEHLDRFDWEPVSMGDFAACIHALGKIYVTLVYHRGDDEFPPEVDVLFDGCIQHVFPTEDVAVLASRICLGLL